MARVEYEVGSNLVYAAIHEFGGIIRPRNVSGRLVFEIDGELVFAREVTIPARPYLRPAFDQNQDEMLSAFTRVMEAQIQRILRS